MTESTKGNLLKIIDILEVGLEEDDIFGFEYLLKEMRDLLK